MPSTGMSSSSSSERSSGAPSEYTDAGPPDSTSAAGRRSLMRSKSVVCGRSSANTPHSRILRAISWEYCPPKSRTSTSSRAACGGRTATVSEETVSVPVTPLAAVGVAGTAAPSVIADGYSGCDSGPSVGPHAHGLLALELLALGLKRGRDHHLSTLEVADVLVSTRCHGCPQGSNEVEGAVVLLRRAEQDMLQGAVPDRRHPGPAWEGWMECRHAPMESAARRLLGAGEGRADHDRVGAAGDGLGHVAAGSHAAVTDHVAVLAGLQHVLGARRCDVGDRGGLRHTDPQYAARGAGRAGADPDEHPD